MVGLKKLLNSDEKWYIHSKTSDLALIILCPFIALLIVFLVCEPRGENYIYSDLTPVWFAVGASVLTHAHVLLVFARSHLNRQVFSMYPYRFTLIPLVALIALIASTPLFLLFTVIAVYWDEWHSLMQTFGFGRIYDGKLGNNPLQGRKLDMGMAFVVGLLPNIVLLTYLPESQVDQALLEYMELPKFMVMNYKWLVHGLRIPLILFGIGYSLYYAYSYWCFYKEGYRFSPAKFLLFFSTGISTVIIAMVFTIADGVFFGNIYHAIQYIFIVMVSEQTNLSSLATKEKNANKKIGLLIFFFLIIPLIFIFAGIRQITQDVKYIAAFWLLTSLLHFWFDGFIWSVRRQDLK